MMTQAVVLQEVIVRTMIVTLDLLIVALLVLTTQVLLMTVDHQVLQARIAAQVVLAVDQTRK